MLRGPQAAGAVAGRNLEGVRVEVGLSLGADGQKPIGGRAQILLAALNRKPFRRGAIIIGAPEIIAGLVLAVAYATGRMPPVRHLEVVESPEICAFVVRSQQQGHPS